MGTTSSQSLRGSIQNTSTPSSATLVLAAATTTPTVSICGRRWNCGAAPEIVITAAIAVTLTTAVDTVASRAATHCNGPGAGNCPAIARKTSRQVTAPSAYWDRLKTSLRRG